MHIIITDSISLRAYRKEDRQDLVTGLNDWRVARWLATVPYPYRLDHADAYLARPEHRADEAAFQDSEQTLALAICHHDRLIGGLSLVPEPQKRRGCRRKCREFGFWLSQPFWGRRIMRKAVQAVISEVRRQAPLTGFVTSANHDNHRSQALIVSLGFVADDEDEVFSIPLQRQVRVIQFHLP